MKKIDTIEPRTIKSEDLENEYYPTWTDDFESFDPELDLVETSSAGWFAKYLRLCQGLTMEETEKLCSIIIEAERRNESLRTILKEQGLLQTFLERRE